MREYERTFAPIALPGEDPAAIRRRLVMPIYHRVTAGQVLPVEVFDLYLPAVDGSEPLRFRRIIDSERMSFEVCTKIGVKPDRYEKHFAARLGAGTAMHELMSGGEYPTITQKRNVWREGRCVLHVAAVYLPTERGAVGYLLEVEGPKDEVDAYQAPDGWREVTKDGRFGCYTIATKGWPVDG